MPLPPAPCAWGWRNLLFPPRALPTAAALTCVTYSRTSAERPRARHGGPSSARSVSACTPSSSALPQLKSSERASMRAVEGGHQSGTTSRHPTALYSDLAGRRQQPSARRAALSAAAGPRDSKAHGGALPSVPSPPASPPAELTIARIEPRTSHSAVTNGGEHGEAGPVGTRGCRLDSARGAARRGSARPNYAPTAPRNAPSARRHREQPAEQAGLGRGYSNAPACCPPSGPAAGEQCSIGPPGTQPGSSCYRPHAIGVLPRMLVSVHVCMCVYVSVAQP